MPSSQISQIKVCQLFACCLPGSSRTILPLGRESVWGELVMPGREQGNLTQNKHCSVAGSPIPVMVAGCRPCQVSQRQPSYNPCQQKPYTRREILAMREASKGQPKNQYLLSPMCTFTVCRLHHVWPQLRLLALLPCNNTDRHLDPRRGYPLQYPTHTFTIQTPPCLAAAQAYTAMQQVL